MSYSSKPESKKHLLKMGESLSAGLPALVADAQSLVQSLMQGRHGHQKAGIGDPFWEYRLATADDDFSRIDWRQSARTGTLSIREKEMQNPHTVYIWCDQSASMNFTSRPDTVTKGERAVVLSFALADLLSRGGERLGFMNSLQTGSGRPALVTGKRVLDHFLTFLMTTENYTAHETLPIQDISAHSSVIFLTDGFFDIKEWHDVIEAYASKGVKGLIIQIMDDAEKTFPYTSHTHFTDPEDPETVYDSPSPKLQKDAYQALFEASFKQLKTCLESAGWSLLPHMTHDNPLETLGIVYGLLIRKEHTRY
jgi:uncharacterized protein (DUF58 family)